MERELAGRQLDAALGCRFGGRARIIDQCAGRAREERFTPRRWNPMKSRCI
jgi:hypothetical protein